MAFNKEALMYPKSLASLIQAIEKDDFIQASILLKKVTKEDFAAANGWYCVLFKRDSYCAALDQFPGAKSAIQAAINQLEEFMHTLSVEGFDLNAIDCDGYTPLTKAIYFGKLNIIQYLVGSLGVKLSVEHLLKAKSAKEHAEEITAYVNDQLKSSAVVETKYILPVNKTIADVSKRLGGALDCSS
jgi:ankyrin repeat protein